MQSMLWEEKLVSVVENKLLTVIFYFGLRGWETGKLKHGQTLHDRITLLKTLLYSFSKSSKKLMLFLNMKKYVCLTKLKLKHSFN